MAVQEFAAPVSLDEALPAFAGGDQPAWLAGGTDLLVGMRLGAKNPDRIVDLKRIPELMAIVEDETAVRLGAAVASYDLVRHPTVAGLYPGLAEALDLIGSTQIQGRCSAGGNLCNASPAADSIPALIANSPEEFARQISKACQLQKNKQLESMGRSARRFVLEQYDSLEVARQLAQAYGELSVESL